VTGTCRPEGTSRFRFVVTGTALGPYPGTFAEKGTFTLGPMQPAPDNPTGDPAGNHYFPPLRFHAVFQIRSAAGLVTGRKTLAAVPPPTPEDPFFNFGACGQVLAQPGMTTPHAVALQIRADYRARIRTHGRTFVDRGEDMLVEYGDLGVRGIPNFQSWGFLESFE